MSIEEDPHTGDDALQEAVREAIAGAVEDRSGRIADYIPALAYDADDRFGAAIATDDGRVISGGDAQHPFTIQSISKPFVFGLVCDAFGYEDARRLLGANNTGLPFDSAMAIELGGATMTNPMVNAGAIAATSLVPGLTVTEKWERIQGALSLCAGRELVPDETVYRSEMEHNQVNHGMAQMMASRGRMYFDPAAATELYTRQCSLEVTVEDLAVMGATLGNRGVNPRTGAQALSAESCLRVLALLATAGLYQHSGEWLYDTGLPAKSGVSGGVMAVAPGFGGVAGYSPAVDEAGTSVRGRLAVAHISRELGLNIFGASSRW